MLTKLAWCGSITKSTFVAAVALTLSVVCSAQGVDRSRADRSYQEGVAAYKGGDYFHANRSFEDALAGYRSLGLKREEQYSLTYLGYVGHTQADSLVVSGSQLFKARNFASANAAWQQAASIYRRLGLSQDEAKVRQYIHLVDGSNPVALYKNARTAYMNHDFGKAISLFGQAAKGFAGLGLLKQYRQSLAALETTITAASKAINDGSSSIASGNLRSAEDAEQQALSIYEAADRKDDEAISLGNLATLALYRGDLKQSVDYYKRAVAIYKQTGKSRLAVPMAVTFCELMVGYGFYDQIEIIANELIEFVGQEGMKSEEARLLLVLAKAKQGLGSLDEALPLLRRSANIFASLKDSMGLTGSLLGLGAISEDLGDYANARDAFDSCRRVSHDHRLTIREAGALSGLASLEYRTGNQSGAIGDYEKVLSVYRSLGRTQEVAGTYNSIGDCNLKEGQLESALADYRAGGSDPIRLGRYYLRAGNPVEAKRKFQTSLSVSKAALDIEGMISSITGLGQSEERMGHVEKAADWYRQAVGLLETQRNNAGSKALFLEGTAGGFSRVQAYTGLSRCLVSLGRYEDAYLAAEQTKGRMMSEAVATSSFYDGRPVPPDLLKQETDLRHREEDGKRLRAELRRLIVPELNNPKALRGLDDALGKMAKDIKEVQEEQADLVKQLRREYPEYAAMKYPEPLGAPELMLYSNEYLLEFEVTDTQTIAFLLGRPKDSKEPKVIKVWQIPVSQEDLENEVHLFRRGMETVGRTNGESGWRDFDPLLAHSLYRLLLAPAFDVLSARDRLLVVPDGVLCQLPLEALVMDNPPSASSIIWTSRTGGGEYPSGLHYVGDDRVLTYWQSGTSLTILRRLREGMDNARKFRPDNGRVLVVADPIYDSRDVRVGTLGASQWHTPEDVIPAQHSGNGSYGQTVVTSSFREINGSRRLPDTGIFASQLARSDLHAETLTGAEACESRILSAPLDRYGLAVLFATHGTVDERSPYIHEAALMLSNPAIIGEPDAVKVKGGPEQQIDGYLTMSKIMRLHFRCELAGALACHTGQGYIVAGEGVMNLGRAFQFAGCRSALISLFSVPGPPTNLMAESLLTDMRYGVPKDQAILSARRKLRQAGYGHPIDWASFVLVGEPDVTILAGRPPAQKASPIYIRLLAACAPICIVIVWLLCRFTIGSIRRISDGRLSGGYARSETGTMEWSYDGAQALKSSSAGHRWTNLDVRSRRRWVTCACLIAVLSASIFILDPAARTGYGETTGHLDESDANGVTPLMWAAFSNDTKKISTLIAEGVDLNAQDHGGDTALMLAALKGNAAAVSQLIAAGADLNCQDEHGSTAIVAAASQSNADCVKELVAAGADLSDALQMAATSGDLASLNDLLSGGADVNSPGHDRLTALASAAVSGHLDCLNALISAGAKVDAKGNGGMTALMAVVGSDKIDCAAALIRAGANVNAKDDTGMTPLIWTAFVGKALETKYFLEVGAKLNAIDNNGHTALSTAAMRGNASCVQFLLSAGANVNVRDSHGCTAVMLAASPGNSLDCVQQLTRAHADVNVSEDSGGLTALMLAVGEGNLQVVRALIAAGANANAKNKAGTNALALSKDSSMTTILRAAGAKE